ncbi:MAG: HEAT repeat domain-containing protein, partial [Candidatus Latescibacterota bacterium]
PLVAKMLAPNKPVEELYDLDADPYEVHNLAESKAYANTLVRLRKAHENWTIETRDVGLMPEPEMIRAIQKNGSADKIFTSETGLNHLKTIRTTADAARRGDQTTLLAALNSDDASVRFWGAVGLGLVKQGKDKLKQSLKDASPSVRVASAQSLIQMGRANEATPVLLTSLTHEDPWIRLMAALAIDENDAVAKTVLDQLPPYREDKSKYVARVVNRTLNRIQGTSEQVR